MALPPRRNLRIPPRRRAAARRPRRSPAHRGKRARGARGAHRTPAKTERPTRGGRSSVRRVRRAPTNRAEAKERARRPTWPTPLVGDTTSNASRSERSPRHWRHMHASPQTTRCRFGWRPRHGRRIAALGRRSKPGGRPRAWRGASRTDETSLERQACPASQGETSQPATPSRAAGARSRPYVNSNAAAGAAPAVGPRPGGQRDRT